jgi:hypothetical protein
MNEANETHRVASAIAAFQLTQLAFAALVKKGILPKAEAEEILRQAIEAIETGGSGDRAADGVARRLDPHPQPSPRADRKRPNGAWPVPWPLDDTSA